MSAIDLYGELAAARPGLCADDPERQWLWRHHVRCPLPGWTRGHLDGDRYEPHDVGEKFFVFPVLDAPHECFGGCVPPKSITGRPCALVDLAAWRPSEPQTVRLRCGNVAALGHWELEATFMESEFPLQLHSTPLAWFSAKCRGAVIVDWGAAAMELLNRPKVICDSVELGERLERELKAARRRATPRLPEIHVLRLDEGAA